MPPQPHGEDRSIPLPDGRALWVHDVAGPAPDAPALVLLHGLGVTAHLTWRTSYAALAEHFRVLAFDLRGHGRGLRTQRFTLEDCAHDALAVVDALGLSPAVIAGYSLGGAVATLAWRCAPQRVAGLVLAATASDFGRGARWLRPLVPVAAGLAALRPEFVRRQLVAFTALRLGDHEPLDRIERELAGHDPVALVQAVGEAGLFSSRPWLATIDVPVAVVVTSEDDRIPPAQQRALAAAIPGASLLEAPGLHTACATHDFAPRLVEACRDVWARAGHARLARPVATALSAAG